jgi:hypothetical protein
LTVLRHVLRLGKRWSYLADVPEITLPKKPEGRLRYLEGTEIGKLREVPQSVPLGDRDAGAQHGDVEGGDPRARVGAR